MGEHLNRRDALQRLAGAIVIAAVAPSSLLAAPYEPPEPFLRPPAFDAVYRHQRLRAREALGFWQRDGVSFEVFDVATGTWEQKFHSYGQHVLIEGCHIEIVNTPFGLRAERFQFLPVAPDCVEYG